MIIGLVGGSIGSTQSEVVRIVVSAESWPISDHYWSPSASRFTLNTFDWLTEFSPGKRILKDSHCGTIAYPPTKNNMVDTLQTNGYTVTITDTTSWTPTVLASYDAVLIEEGPIDHTLLTEYVMGGGGVFLIGGHYGSELLLNEFLMPFGMSLLEPVILGQVTLTSFVPHPVTTGVSALETLNPTPIVVHSSEPTILATWGGWNWLVVYSQTEASTTGLVAHYQFENNVQDSAGSDHGTNHGATFVEGKLGTALHFDGVDDYMEVPDSGVLRLTTPFTLEAWVHPEGEGSETNRNNPIIWKLGSIGTNEDNYGLAWGSSPCYGGISHAFIIRIERASDGEDFRTCSYSHPINQWYHVVGLYDGTTLQIYVNGVLEGVNYVGSFLPYAGSAPLQIGGLTLSDAESQGSFTGTIDEVRIYNRALSKEEVEQHYQAEITSSRAPTITVVSPNGGEYWGGAQMITWTAINSQGDPLIYTVYYSPNGGQTWTRLATGLTESSYLWDTTTFINGANCMIRVEATDGTHSGVDVSDTPFEIANELMNTAPTVLVICPNGGERVHGTFEIQWSANDPDGGVLTFTLSYSSNAEQKWTQIANGVTGTSFQWDTSGVQVGENYLVKIEATDGRLTAEDRSDYKFTVEREASIETSMETFFVPSFKVIEVLGALLVLLGLLKRNKRRKI